MSAHVSEARSCAGSNFVAKGDQRRTDFVPRRFRIAVGQLADDRLPNANAGGYLHLSPPSGAQVLKEGFPIHAGHYGGCNMPFSIALLYRQSNLQKMETIGLRLRAMRKARELNQTEVAKLAGVDQSTISDIERGMIPRSDLLMKLCRVFETTAEYLVEGTGDAGAARDTAHIYALLSAMRPEVREAAIAAIEGMARRPAQTAPAAYEGQERRVSLNLGERPEVQKGHKTSKSIKNPARGTG